jgi:Ca-activated chloride channel homolog
VRFDNPERFALLVVVALIAVAVFARRRRSDGDTVRFADAGLLEELRTAAPRPWRRRFVAAGLLFSALLSVLSAADPQRLAPTETNTQTVVLAFDVSRSMEAVDVAPSRIEAARTAALSFIDSAPDGVSIGLVSFSSTVRVVAAPTTDREVLRTAVSALRTDAGTAVGEAVFTSIGLLETRGWGEDADGRAIQLRSGAVVVLSDGATTVGRPDTDAAAAAALAGVQIFTIAFGTPSGVIDAPEGQIPVPAAPDVMAQYADETGAASYEAFTGAELARIFEDLATSISVERGWVSFADLVALVAVIAVAATAAVWARSTARL